MNCIVHGVANSRTQLSGFDFHFIIINFFTFYILTFSMNEV